MSVRSWISGFRISTQVHILLGTAVLGVLSISLISLYTLARVEQVQKDISETNIPEMLTAFSVARQASEYAAKIPKLTTAKTPQALAASYEETERKKQAFESILDTITKEHADVEAVRQIQADGVILAHDVESLMQLAQEKFELQQHSLTFRNTLQNLRRDLLNLLNKDIERLRGEHVLSAEDFNTYRGLAELHEEAILVPQLFISALTVSQAAQLQPLRESFAASILHVNNTLSYLQTYSRHETLSSLFQDLFALGQEQQNGFALHERELAIEEKMSALLAETQAMSIDIMAQIERVESGYAAETQEISQQAHQAVATGWNLLLLLNILSIVGAVLIGWFYVERHLIRRLNTLVAHIRRLASGNLDDTLEIVGNDEIAEMEEALEVFRENAVELQRLSIAEQLAEELQVMYADLEKSNEELQQAQNQIIAQEKLAALGELTTGVAHEIKNPMNFIMNFAEGSQELLGELLEELKKLMAGKEYDSELIDELTADLDSNMKRITDHGNRANHIVADMLKMGHISGQWEMSDIHNILDESIKLACFSARSIDPNFQMEVQKNYSPDIPELLVQPQDLGRVFLNLISNSAHATAGKLKDLHKQEKGAGNAFQPMTRVSTASTDDQVEIRVRDNGSGIPEATLESIFNPFFTTKAPSEGTGLGLSLAADIIREHGGTIKVDTKENEFTEMIIVLPREIAPPEGAIVASGMPDKTDGA